ncbi:hypothetical protein CAI21_17065 [Alkalilimnicola ehrlichii]|uniref:Uncharacterized protein n=1 Tax=Alkalilimnicola ehrlichii TaxID=351052 RepID=A0A3E0WM17_9GAMM|nr:hypothetical protein CAI21_17065 [Alkalilimnicola ehrlichii]RFA33459.1 hypothetical protein CAL65_17545 [Alkalilimnicola ehrlichii]
MLWPLPLLGLASAALLWRSVQQRKERYPLFGVLFALPIVLGYTAWTYWVFRGKVKAGAAYH